MKAPRTTPVVAALSALGLVAAGLAAPAAHGAPSSPVALRSARPEATAPAALSFEFVSTWGTYGSGFDKHMSPHGIDVLGDHVYVADTGSHSIEIDYPGGGTIFNSPETSSTDLTAFSSPADIAVVNEELFYVADSGNNRIVRREAGVSTAWGTAGANIGQFYGPWALDVGPSGHVYVLDGGNRRVQEFTAAGSFVRSWGGTGDGPGQFSNPVGLAVAPDGSVYVVDAGHKRVIRFSATGGYLGEWGATGSSALVVARGIDVAPDGNVYVVDDGLDLVRVYSATGTPLGSLGGPGAGDGEFTGPWGVDVDAAGLVRVSDQLGYDIQTFRPVLAALSAPKVSGSAKVGGTLRATAGSWPVPDVELAYQWLRAGNAISGAKSPSYQLKKADAGQKISVRVTASRSDYPTASSARSSSVKVAKIAPKVSLKLAKKSIKASAKAKVTVRVKVKGIAKPTGKVRIYDGKKRIKTVTLKAKHKGKLTVTLPRLKVGKHKVKVTYLGSKQVVKKTSAPKTLTVRR